MHASGYEKCREYDSLKGIVWYILNEHIAWIEYLYSQFIGFLKARSSPFRLKEKRFQLNTDILHTNLSDNKDSCQFYNSKVMRTHTKRAALSNISLNSKTDIEKQVSRNTTQSHDQDHNLTTPQLNNTQERGIGCVLKHLVLSRAWLNLQNLMHFLHWYYMPNVSKAAKGTTVYHYTVSSRVD